MSLLTPGVAPAGLGEVVYRTPRGESGFAFLMLLGLIVVLGLGLSAVATFWQTTARREKERELLFIGQQFRGALLSYAGPTRQYPQSLDQLLLDERAPAVRRHLRRIYVDPLTGKPEWGLVTRAGRIIGVYSLAVGAPLIRTGFPRELEQFGQAQTYADWRFLAEATPKSANESPSAVGDGQVGAVSAPPAPLPDRRQTVEDDTTRCDRLFERAVEQCWSDLNSDEANNRCQDQAQQEHWQCLGARPR